jgi:hypothetical protein
MARFTYIWEFRIAASAQAQFEFEYGPRGFGYRCFGRHQDIRRRFYFTITRILCGM